MTKKTDSRRASFSRLLALCRRGPGSSELRRELAEAVLERVEGELKATREFKLSEDRGQVIANRHLADVQTACDLQIAKTLSHERHDLTLPARE